MCGAAFQAPPSSSVRGVLCAGAAVVLTLYALVVDNITLAGVDYSAAIIQTVLCSAAALVLVAVGWPRMSRVLRVVSVTLALSDFWTLADAGGRCLPAVLGL